MPELSDRLTGSPATFRRWFCLTPKRSASLHLRRLEPVGGPADQFFDPPKTGGLWHPQPGCNLFGLGRIQINRPREPYFFVLIGRRRTRSQTKRSLVEAGLHQLEMVDEDVDSLLRPVAPPLLAALGLIISAAAPIGSTRLSGWLDDNADGFGRWYISELGRTNRR